MEEDNRFINSNFAEVFGDLQKIHRVRRGCTENFVIPGMIFCCLVFGVLTYVASGDWWTIPVCVLPFLLLFCGLIWHLFKTRRDELRIYEQGFTCQSGKSLQTCLWTEIKSLKYREPSAGEIARLESGKTPLDSVKKKNGEIIGFDDDLPGTTEIIEKFEEFKAKPKLKR